MKIVALVLLSATVTVAASNAIALQSSKAVNQTAITCRDKLSAKHIKGAERRKEHDKCMSDPYGYQ